MVQSSMGKDVGSCKHVEPRHTNHFDAILEILLVDQIAAVLATNDGSLIH